MALALAAATAACFGALAAAIRASLAGAADAERAVPARVLRAIESVEASRTAILTGLAPVGASR